MMFGEKLRKLREDKGISQSEIADFMGTSQKTISKWEIGIAEPSQEKKEKVANFFGVHVSYFYDGEQKSEVSKLLDKLEQEGIITGADDIDDDIASMIINAVKLDLQMKKLKKKQG